MGGAANGGVVCGVCLNHCDYEIKQSCFSMYVWENLKHAGVVSWNERVRFNNIIGKKAIMDAHKQIECEMETKTEVFLKEGLGQQPKIDSRERSTAGTRDWLNSVPRTATDLEDDGSDPGVTEMKKAKRRMLKIQILKREDMM